MYQYHSFHKIHDEFYYVVFLFKPPLKLEENVVDVIYMVFHKRHIEFKLQFNKKKLPGSPLSPFGPANPSLPSLPGSPLKTAH